MDKSEREAFVMLKSMTGFGRCENITDEYRISVEMKAVMLVSHEEEQFAE